MLNVTMHWYAFQVLTMRSRRLSAGADLVLFQQAAPVLFHPVERFFDLFR